MPMEYELRFKLEHALSDRLAEKGFRRKVTMRMADLVFEPKD